MDGKVERTREHLYELCVRLSLRTELFKIAILRRNYDIKGIGMQSVKNQEHSNESLQALALGASEVFEECSCFMFNKSR